MKKTLIIFLILALIPLTQAFDCNYFIPVDINGNTYYDWNTTGEYHWCSYTDLNSLATDYNSLNADYNSLLEDGNTVGSIKEIMNQKTNEMINSIEDMKTIINQSKEQMTGLEETITNTGDTLNEIKETAQDTKEAFEGIDLDAVITTITTHQSQETDEIKNTIKSENADLKILIQGTTTTIQSLLNQLKESEIFPLTILAICILIAVIIIPLITFILTKKQVPTKFQLEDSVKEHLRNMMENVYETGQMIKEFTEKPKEETKPEKPKEEEKKETGEKKDE